MRPEPGDRLGFAAQTRQLAWVNELRSNEGERALAIERGVVDKIDDFLASLAENALNDIAAGDGAAVRQIVGLAEVLSATKGDASTALLHQTLIDGTPLAPMPRVLWKEVRAFERQRLAFTERLRLGVRGTTDDGRTISFEAPGPGGGPMLVIVATLSQTPRGEPLVHLTLASEWLEQRRPEEAMLGWLFPVILPSIRGGEGKP